MTFVSLNHGVQCPPCECSHCRNLPISSGSDPLQPRGHPIIHSRKAMNTPPVTPCLCATSFKGLELRACVASLAAPDFQSRQVGVGSIARDASALGRFVFRMSLPLAVGVANIAVNVRCAGHFCMLGEPSFPAPVGVGSNDPHAVASVWRTDVPSSKHTPDSIIPQAGKPFEDALESVSAQIRGVLGEDIRRLDLSNDAQHFEPKARAISVQPGTSTGAADVLTGEAAADDIDVAVPGISVKGADVIPDGKGVEHPVTLTLGEHTLTMFIDFDGADGTPPEQVGTGEQSATGSGK
jgi:hypothetical protein